MFRRRSSSANSSPRLFGLCPNLVLNNFPTNFIVTSKYNLITFLPIALLYQFKRYANVYFLIIAIIQSIPILSPLSPFSSWSPLVFVLAVSLIREALEDISRHKSDKEMNSSLCTILRPSPSDLPHSSVLPHPSTIQMTAPSSYPLNPPSPPKTTPSLHPYFFRSIEWGKLKVGDWVYLKEGNPVPADLVVLACSAENGICFIETASLDGEKNLKVRNCVKDTSTLINPEQPNFLEGELWAQTPNSSLGQFEGSIKLVIKRI
jgi:magnesium-transporting ATPase (P-type)